VSGGGRATQGCPCGYWRTGLRECRCSDGDVVRYRSRVSGPLLDRIDLYVDVPSVEVSELRANGGEETSTMVRARVVAARRRRRLGAATQLTPSAEVTLARAARNMALSVSRCIGVARTNLRLRRDSFHLRHRRMQRDGGIRVDGSWIRRCGWILAPVRAAIRAGGPRLPDRRCRTGRLSRKRPCARSSVPAFRRNHVPGFPRLRSSRTRLRARALR